MIRSFTLLALFLIASHNVNSQEYYNKNIFGFATSNTFTYFDVNDNEFKEKIDKISPKILRFPGGAVGNFYHFDGSAYGMKINEIDSLILGKFPKRARGLISYSKRKKHNKNYIHDFIDLAKYSKSSAVLVANVLTETKEDIVKMIKYILDHDIPVIGVELGSEMSNKSYFDKGYTIDIYIKKVEEISAFIKSNYPEIQTAIVAAPLVKDQKHRHSIWNKKLASLDFYDAIIIHSYAKVVKGKGQYGQMIVEKNEGSKEESFSIYNKRIQSFFSEDYPKEIERYNSIFQNKPIWITEWNLQYSKKTGNTLLQGLFVANFFLELISNDIYKNIELTTFHNLAGRDFGGSIFQKKDNKTLIQSTFIPIQIVSRFFNSKDLKVKKQVIAKDFYKYEFFNNMTLVYECYVNWSNSAKEVESLNKKCTRVLEYGSLNLYDLNSDINKISFEQTSTKIDEKISISPYSLTLIE